MSRACLWQADKLVFIASQAAVERHGNQLDMYEQDVAALCEAEMSEEDASVRNATACDEEDVQLVDSEDSASEEEDTENPGPNDEPYNEDLAIDLAIDAL